MRFVRSVPGRSTVERSDLGGVEFTPEEDLPRFGPGLDDRRQTARETRRRKSVQVGYFDKYLLVGTRVGLGTIFYLS